MAALATAKRESATLLPFPGAAQNLSSGVIATALRRHRLPELLAAQLLRAAGDSEPQAGLARALAARMGVMPLDFAGTRPILLLGAAGVGKSAVAAAIAAAAGRETLLLPAREGLNQLRAGRLPANTLVVMEAEGFHPLNPKARGAFAALNDMAEVDAVGVICAAGDAEDAAEMVSALRFRRLIVTGLDRTRRLGALTAAVTRGARLAHVLKGGALERLYPESLAAALLSPL